MNLEEILYHIRRKQLGKKALKIILIGCVFLVIMFVALFAIAAVLAFKYHTQIYDIFIRIIDFIFGDSPDNVIREFFKQIVDNFLKDLFSEN